MMIRPLSHPAPHLAAAREMRALRVTAAALVLCACAGGPAAVAPPGPTPGQSPPEPHPGTETLSTPGQSEEANAPSAPGDKATADHIAAIRASKLSVIALHRVADFEKYQAYLGANTEARRSAGVVGYLVSRDEEEPQRVVVHFAAESKEKANTFLASPQVMELLQGDGAPESSVLWMADNVLIDLPPVPLVNSHSLFLKVPVKDFGKLQSGLIGSLATWREQGLGMLALLRSTSGENVAILHITGKDRTSLEQIYAHAAFQKALTDAGANSERKPIFAKDVR